MEEHNSYSDVTPEIVRLAELSKEAGVIDTELYTKYDVKRGLRDLNGKRRACRTNEYFRCTRYKDGGW